MKKLLPIAVATMLSTSLFAGNATGLYVGAGGGSYNAKFPLGAGVNFDSGSGAEKAIVGYNIGIVPLINVGIEGNYVLLNSGNDFKGTNMTLEGVLGFNLGPIALFGKYGVGSYNLKYNGSSIANSSDPAYGVGISANIGAIGVRAEYEWMSADQVDLNYGTVSVTYTF